MELTCTLYVTLVVHHSVCTKCKVTTYYRSNIVKVEASCYGEHYLLDKIKWKMLEVDAKLKQKDTFML